MYSQETVHTAETEEQTPLSNNTTDTAKQETELDSSEVYVAYKEGDVVAIIAYLDVKGGRQHWGGIMLESDWYVYKKNWMNDVIKKKDWEDNYDVLKTLTPELMGDIDTLVESYPVTKDPNSNYNNYHTGVFSKVLFDKILDKLKIIIGRRKQNTEEFTYGLKTSHGVVRNFVNITGSTKLSVHQLIRFFEEFDNSIEKDGYDRGFVRWYGYYPIRLKIQIGWRRFNNYANYMENTRKYHNNRKDVQRNWYNSLEKDAAVSSLNEIVLLVDLLVQLGIPLENVPINELKNHMINMIGEQDNLKQDIETHFRYLDRSGPIKGKIDWAINLGFIDKKRMSESDLKNKIFEELKETLTSDIKAQ